MHELSIAMGIVDAALEEAQRRGVQVIGVHLRLGALCGVVKDALLFFIRSGMPGHPTGRFAVDRGRRPGGCVLSAVSGALDAEFRAVVLQSFSCPECSAPTPDVLQGKELEVFALEVQD
jgi:hydrogenase nickel incorporation protein HypA/HybF